MEPILRIGSTLDFIRGDYQKLAISGSNEMALADQRQTWPLLEIGINNIQGCVWLEMKGMRLIVFNMFVLGVWV